MKTLIFDSGAIISFSMSGLLPELRKLKEIFNGDFIITHEVKKEVIDKPLSIKKFELEALKIQELLNDKTLQLPESIGVSQQEIAKEMRKILDEVNSLFIARGKNIKLIHDGEASCLALNKVLAKKGYKSAVAVDERTTRLLGESPENLRKFMEKKLHTNIEMKKSLPDFSKFFFFRSTELIYVAYKKGIVKIKDKNVLDALLYALKFKGASISGEEIEEIKRIG